MANGIYNYPTLLVICGATATVLSAGALNQLAQRVFPRENNPTLNQLMSLPWKTTIFPLMMVKSASRVLNSEFAKQLQEELKEIFALLSSRRSSDDNRLSG